jgi:ribokinase
MQNSMSACFSLVVEMPGILAVQFNQSVFLEAAQSQGLQLLTPAFTALSLLQGANQAATAAKLSYPTYFLGKVGTDSYTAPLRAALAGAGVRLDHLQEVPGPSGTAVILLQASGEGRGWKLL